MARIENHKFTIEEAFRECFYVVPDYQREYVWTDKEVQQLLDDITDQVDSGSELEYFVGMVLVSPGSTKNSFEVIDGQQRLTTFFLLLCALRNRFQGAPQHTTINGLLSTTFTTNDGENHTALKLHPRYENADELMDRLVALDAPPETVRHSVEQSGVNAFGSLEKLLNAYAVIYRYLNDNFEEDKQLRRFWGFLANNVVFIQISTGISSALKIFETINERGVGLNPMDLLKNLLFTQVSPHDFVKLKDMWKRITGPLEKAGEKPLRFMRYFLMANYKIHNKDGVVREDNIYDWFIDKRNVELCDYRNKPFDFVRKLIWNVERYLSFSAGRRNDDQASVPMDNLRRLCGGAFSLHYVLLLAVAKYPPRLFDHFVAQLESFLFYYIFTKTPTKELERTFSSWADELRAIGEHTDSGRQRTELNEFIAQRFQSNMSAKDAELADALRRYSFRSMQQYRTRYFLAKLTQHVDMAFKGLNAPGTLEDYAVLEMEHILPNTPDPTLRREFETANPGCDYDEYKNKLGNFTLLEKPINIVASNGYFKAKMEEYRKCKHYLTSSIVEMNQVGKNSSINRINTKLRMFDTWTAQSIDERQAMLIDLARDVWKTSLIPTP